MAEPPATVPPVVLAAPAKLNLGLHVVAKRGDGFHEIDSLFARLDLADEVAAWPVPEGVGGEVLVDDPRLAREPLRMDDDNLMVRAARAYLAAAGAPGGVRLRLRKRIPLAAGLGGGSSDAAATLRALARLRPAPVDLPALAARLGSDVPFFLLDAPAARVRGRGERLEPVALPPRHVVLVNPGVAVSAAEGYAALQAFTARLPLEEVRAALREGTEPPYRNALQPGVTRAHPEVRAALDALRRAGLTGVLMSGSGATCFGLAADAAAAEAAAARLAAARPDWWVRAAVAAV